MRRPALVLAVTLAIAAVVRLALLAGLSSHLDRAFAPDSAGYEYFAAHLWGDVWSRDPTSLAVTLLRTPGYPLFLALLGRVTLLVLLAQIVMSLTLAWITFRLARTLVAESEALLAAAIVGLEPSGLIYDFYILTEVLFAVIFATGIVLWIRGMRGPSWPWLAGAGAVLGIATTVRPVSLYVLVALLPVTMMVARSRTALAGCLAMTLAFSLPIAIWTTRNIAVSGHVIFSTV